MSLKLFRHTGYHSILAPGETRVAMHPLWAVLAASAWIGLVCNVWLWQSLMGNTVSPQRALGLGLVVGGAACVVLSLCGWRRTFKPVATVLLFGAALLAGGAWTQGLPLDTVLAQRQLGPLLPSWAALFGWKVPTLLVVLGLVPVLWLVNKQLRRLTGPAQLTANLTGMAIGALLVVAGGLWLAMHPVAA